MSPEEQSTYKDKVYRVLGLKLSPYAKNCRKVSGTLLSEDIADTSELIVWHGMMKNSIFSPKSIFNRSLSVPDLMKVLKTLRVELCIPAYCQHERTRDIIGFQE